MTVDPSASQDTSSPPRVECEEQQETVAWQIIKARALGKAQFAPAGLKTGTSIATAQPPTQDPRDEEAINTEDSKAKSS